MEKLRSVKLNMSRKIMVIVVLSILITATSIGAVSSIMSRNTVIQEVSSGLESLASESAKHIDSKIDKDLSVLEEASKRTEFTSGSQADQVTTMKRLIKDLDYVDMGFIDMKGNLHLANANIDINISDEAYVKEVLAGNKALSSVFASKSTGDLIVTQAVPVFKDSK